MTIVLARNRDGKEILWQCAECGKPFNLGWGDYCNACIAQQRRHEELVKALTNPNA